jgi:hypothetical protein
MKSDAEDARYTASAPTSSGSAMRRAGIFYRILSGQSFPSGAQYGLPGRA